MNLAPLQPKKEGDVNFSGIDKPRKVSAYKLYRETLDYLNSPNSELEAIAEAKQPLLSRRATLPQLALAEFDKTLQAIGGDEVAADILGREILLEAREITERWHGSDWLTFQNYGGNILREAVFRIDKGRYAATDLLQGYNTVTSEKRVGIPSRDILKTKLANIDIFYDNRKARLEERFLYDVESSGFRKEVRLLDEWRRREYMNACFPANNRRSPTRQALRSKTPPATLKGVDGELGDSAQKDVEAALDFIGRIADTMGVDASAIDRVKIHNSLAERAFYSSNGITDPDELKKRGLSAPSPQKPLF